MSNTSLLRVFGTILGCVGMLVLLMVWGVNDEAEAGDESKKNDIVVKEANYAEYFNYRDGTKNHMYTISEVPAPRPGRCLVVTGDDEVGVAVYCNTGAS